MLLETQTWKKSTGFAYAFLLVAIFAWLSSDPLHTRFCPIDLKLLNDQYSAACAL